MKNSVVRRTQRTLGVVALAGAFALSGTAAAFASETTVNVLGTPVTDHCTVTVGQSIDSGAIPPAHVTESSTCSF